MRKTCSRTLGLATALALTLSMLATALAAVDRDNCIQISTPKDNAVYYIGETIPMKATVWDQWEEAYTMPTFSLHKKKNLDVVWAAPGEGTVARNKGEVYTAKIKTKGLAAGSYLLYAFTWQAPTKDADPEDCTSPDDRSVDVAGVTLKTLKAPTKVKAKAGKRKVTVTWKKAGGAKQYEIYRSTKKKSGYSKIGTAKKTSYTDKKAKKGKKYYYQVKSVRTGSGTVRSGSSACAASGKVK